MKQVFKPAAPLTARYTIHFHFLLVDKQKNLIWSWISLSQLVTVYLIARLIELTIQKGHYKKWAFQNKSPFCFYLVTRVQIETIHGFCFSVKKYQSTRVAWPPLLFRETNPVDRNALVRILCFSAKKSSNHHKPGMIASVHCFDTTNKYNATYFPPYLTESYKKKKNTRTEGKNARERTNDGSVSWKSRKPEYRA